VTSSSALFSGLLFAISADARFAMLPEPVFFNLLLNFSLPRAFSVTFFLPRGSVVDV